MVTDADRATIPQLFYQSLRQVMNGDCDSMLALWSEEDDVTYIDPHGRAYLGHDALVTYWQRAAELNSEAPGSVSFTAEPLMMHAGDSLISTVMTEHIDVNQPDLPLHMEAVSTNIFRQEGEKWRMVHRHSGSGVDAE
jgi:ketosteroid isomerase-like protein